MRRTFILFVAAMLSLLTAAPATAGCWRCPASECCEEAVQGATGKDVCRNDRICVGESCSCNDCWTSGSSCAGTAEPECDSPFNVCEQHQTFLIVPHGESVDFTHLKRRAAEGTGGSVPPRSERVCRSIA